MAQAFALFARNLGTGWEIVHYPDKINRGIIEEEIILLAGLESGCRLLDAPDREIGLWPLIKELGNLGFTHRNAVSRKRKTKIVR
jgi:hypothetical protein